MRANRKINKIVIHHTAVKTTTQPSDTKMIASMNRTHKTRIGQIPDKNGSTIAYHFYVGKDGTITNTRDVESIGYANSNWEVNKEAINIVAHGNFDIENPTPAQYIAITKTIQELRDIYGQLTVHGHKEFANKTCPGKNFNFDKLISMEFYEKLRRDNYGNSPKHKRIFKDPDAFIERMEGLSNEQKFKELVFLEAIVAEKIGSMLEKLK